MVVDRFAFDVELLIHVPPFGLTGSRGSRDWRNAPGSKVLDFGDPLNMIYGRDPRT
jgi:hypothetical protein